MIPDGFTPHFRKSKFTDPWEPLYSKVEPDQVKMGVILSEAHCNSRNLVHGAFLAAIADNAMGLSCGAVLSSKKREFNGLVTINLSVDYIGRANVGEWISTEIEVLKTGGALCFATCLLFTDKRKIARANATFQVL